MTNYMHLQQPRRTNLWQTTLHTNNVQSLLMVSGGERKSGYVSLISVTTVNRYHKLLLYIILQVR